MPILPPRMGLKIVQGDNPTFYRDFAFNKTLDHGTGPNITFTRTGTATFFDASGTLTTATANTPRFDHNPVTLESRGLLIEEGRTNQCTNAEASGAIGVNGPTGWFIDVNGANGLTRTITQGTLNGFSYIDVRFNGTTSGTTNMRLGDARPVPGASASNGQSWTASAYIALQAGSIPSGTVLRLIARGRDSSNTAIFAITNDISPTSSLVRYVATGTLIGATITQVNHEIRLENIPNATAIDLTLRIAAPQLEQGAFATSYIPTTNAAVARGADSAIVTPISSFYNQAEGTLFAEAIANNIPLSGQFPRPLMVGNATNNNNRIEFYTYLAGAALGIGSGVIAASVSEYGVFGAASGAGSVFKASTAFTTNDFRTAVNGSLFGAADTSGSLPDPSTVTHLFIGRQSTGIGAGTSFYIRKVAYWPKRLPNARLQAISA